MDIHLYEHLNRVLTGMLTVAWESRAPATERLFWDTYYALREVQARLRR